MPIDNEVPDEDRPLRQSVRRVEAHARRRDWIVTVEELVALGLTPRQISHWKAARRLHRKHRGVYAFGREELSPRGTWRAALAAVGRDTWLSHLSVAEARHWRAGLSLPVHVTTTRSGIRSRDGIEVHHAPTAPPGLVLDGLPMTKGARTLADCAALVDERELMALYAEAAHRCHVGRRDLLAELVPGRPGAGTLRAVLATLDVGDGVTRRELGHAFRRLIEHHGIALPEFNARLVVGGRVVFADALWRAQRFVVELDSRLAHGDVVSLFNDGEKDLGYAELGLQGLRLSWRHVVPDERRTASFLLSRVGRRATL